MINYIFTSLIFCKPKQLHTFVSFILYCNYVFMNLCIRNILVNHLSMTEAPVYVSEYQLLILVEESSVLYSF